MSWGAEQSGRGLCGLEMALMSTDKKKATDSNFLNVASLDWTAITEELDSRGCATVGPLLTERQCERIISSYDEQSFFRSTVVMARHGFGRGEYKYFSYPLPRIVQDLRTELYGSLAGIANRWNSIFRRRDSLSQDPQSVLRSLPSRCSIQTNATAVEIWRRRFQLSSSRPIRKARVSVADRLPIVEARDRFHGRRVCLD
jgi:hypothetical protein